MKNEPKPRVLVIGIDGGTLDLIRPWAERGSLPALADLIKGGVSGPLESTMPPVTSPAWPSFMTGKNPGKHGVFDFIRNKQGDFTLVNASSIDGKTLWGILSEAGYKVGVMNVPVTYPPSPVNGFMITGLLSPPNADLCHPPGFLKPYEAELGRYRIVPRVEYREGDEEALIEDLLDLTQTQGRFALRVMETQPWDFLMVHFLATDIAQHSLWRFMDPTHPRHNPAAAEELKSGIQRVYQAVDRMINLMRERLPTDVTIIVMSDHGFGPLHYIVNLNSYLLMLGLLRLKNRPTTQLRWTAFRMGLSPAHAYEWIARLGLQNLTWKVSKEQRNRIISRFLSFEDVDWSRTKAYSMGHVGQLYVNLKGREPHGIVEPGAEYEAVREYLIAALRELRDPHTGKPIVDRILRKEEVCSGPYFDRSPDLYVVMDGYRYISFPLFASRVDVITQQIRGDSGSHRQHGVFIAHGRHIRAGTQVAGARIVDIAPTILYSMGVPVPDDMDGRVLTEIFEPGYSLSHAIQYSKTEPAPAMTEYTMSAEEEQEVLDRLRDLGYLG
ncbi:MAG: alkaline phosphatase family protein [Chloroflexi bacterium]|nr:alkaline phosphatase family protein [Chloroflexota bacterium]